MKTISAPFNLLLVGLGSRLACALTVILSLWAGFFWATAAMGGI